MSSRVERLEREAGLEPGLTRDAAIGDREPERVERTDSEVAELRTRAQRGDRKALVEYAKSDEYRNAFEAIIRARGVGERVGDEFRAALAVGADATGGYLVPDEFFRNIVAKAQEVGNVRPFATTVTTSENGDLLIPKENSFMTVTWLAEGATYTETEPDFAQAILKAYKAGLIAKASDEMLEDPAFDILGYLSGRIGTAFGKETNAKYVIGTSGSTTTPEGVVNKATTAVTLTTGQSTTITSADSIIDLYHSVIDPYRSNGRFLMNDTTVKIVRKFKDATNGQYIWQPGLQAGQPDTLLGRPLAIDPNMPVPAANAKSILFGDLSGYWIRDVSGLRIKVLDQLYAANGQVGVRAELRTDGDLIDTDSVKVLAHSAT